MGGVSPDSVNTVLYSTEPSPIMETPIGDTAAAAQQWPAVPGRPGGGLLSAPSPMNTSDPDLVASSEAAVAAAEAAQAAAPPPVPVPAESVSSTSSSSLQSASARASGGRELLTDDEGGDDTSTTSTGGGSAGSAAPPGPGDMVARVIDPGQETGGRGMKRRRLMLEDRIYRIVVRPLAAKKGGYWVQVPGDMATLREVVRRKLDLEPCQFRDIQHLAVVDDVALFRDEMVLAVTTDEEERTEFGVNMDEMARRQRARRS